MSYLKRLIAQRSGVSDAVVADLALDEMNFLVAEKIGERQSLTPEGFLLVQDTPIARCGIQIYAPQELPLEHYPDFAPAPDGIYRVVREPDEVFNEIAMASANGKPVVDEHPEFLVTPDTHAGAPGVVLNVRRGTGVLEDLLVADLMIYNKQLMQLIQDGKRELSCGYDADYVELAPGRLAQKNIRINHLALVESGRCGPRCAIGDEASPGAGDRTAEVNNEENDDMARRPVVKRRSVMDRVREALKATTSLNAKDKEELEKALKESEEKLGDEAMIEEPEEVDSESPLPSGGAHSITIHNHGSGHAPGEKEHGTNDDPDGDIEERVSRLETAIHEIAEMIKGLGAGNKAPVEGANTDETIGAAGESAEEGKAILGNLELEAPPGAEMVDVRGAKDSRYLSDSFQHTASFAEILAPGIQLPTFDKALAPKDGFKVICDLRRKALDYAMMQQDSRIVIDQIMNGRPLDTKKASCDVIRNTFFAVATVKRSQNNRTMRVGDATMVEQGREHGKPVGKVGNLTDYQKMLNEHYAKQSA